MDRSPPGSSVHELEWLVTPFSRGSSWPRDRTQVSHIAGRFFTIWATRQAPAHHLSSESIHLASRPCLKPHLGSAVGSLTPDLPILPISTITLSVDLLVARVVLIKFPSQRTYGPKILSAKDALSLYWKEVEDSGFIRERPRQHSDSPVWDRHIWRTGDSCHTT